MRKLKSSLAAKLTAVFLFMACLTALLGGAVSIAYMADDGYYSTNTFPFYDSGICANISRDYANIVYNNYLGLSQKETLTGADSYRLEQLKEQFSEQNTNFFFTVTDANDKVVLSNYQKQTYGTQMTFEYNANTLGLKQLYTVNAYIKSPVTANDAYYIPYQIAWFFFSMRFAIPALMVLFAMAALLLFIYLMQSAGHRKGTDEITLSKWNRIPFDLFTFGIFLAGVGTVYICQELRYNGNNIWEVIVFCATVLLLAFWALLLCISFAARVKTDQWWKNTILYRLLNFLLRFIRKVWGVFAELIVNLPLIWKSGLVFTAYMVANFLMLSASFILFIDTDAEVFSFLFCALFNLVMLAAFCVFILQLNKMKTAGEKIATGDYSCKIDTKFMLPEMRAHAETLNNIRLGMSNAVETRLKSERFKTELITNVSHDIKTPLTSIVSYVDLLKKEPIENENALRYLEVLEKQSARLKKLIEDLVEASKASTGNISVTPEHIDAAEFLNQSVGEYTARLAAANLQPVVCVPEDSAAFLADGRLMWRVFDNLLGNICKYSLPNTRVYLDAVGTEGKIIFSLKNISKLPLNISTEELLERFVRGDSARSTEGSGLGLSIARSLTELQNGRFDLSVDGDLFKIVLQFDRIDT